MLFAFDFVYLTFSPFLKFFAYFCGVFSSLILVGQNIAIVNDTLPAVLVTAQDWHIPANTQRLDSIWQVSGAEGANSAVLLSRLFPIYSKSHGTGGSAFLSVRGASAEHTQVYWNGLPLNHGALGLFDFSLLPVLAADEWAIQYGASGLDKPVSGMSASVVAEQKADKRIGWHGQVRQSMGSFGNYQSYFQSQIGKNAQKWVLKSIFNRAQNDFWYHNPTLPGKPLEQRKPENFRQFHLLPAVYFDLKNKGQFSLQTWWQQTRRDLQAPIVAADPNQSQFDRTFRGVARWQSRENTKKGFKAMIAYNAENTRYVNTLLAIDDTTRLQTFLTHTEAWQRVGKRFSIRQQISHQYQSVKSSNYEQPVNRPQTDFFAAFTWQALPRQMVQVQLRQIISSHRAPLLPSLLLNGILAQKENYKLSWSAQTALQFRLPTFNALYWVPGGNKQLLPEQGWANEGRLTLERQTPLLFLNCSLGIYYQQTNNFVVWLPNNGTIWTPQNVRTLAGYGLEWRGRARLRSDKNLFLFDLNYTFSRSVVLRSYVEGNIKVGQQLPYVPFHALSGSTCWQRGNWRLFFTQTLKGKRFTNTNGDTYSTLPTYYIADIEVSKLHKIKKNLFEMNFRIGNITATNYSEVLWQPMPGRSFELSIGTKW